MESPPSFSAHSEAPPLSEDSGLLITSGSVSSDSVSGWLHITSEVNYCTIPYMFLPVCLKLTIMFSSMVKGHNHLLY